MSKDARKIFTKNFKRICFEKGVTGTEFINDLGFTHSKAYNYLNGKRFPNLQNLMLICDYLGITPNDLLLEEEE